MFYTGVLRTLIISASLLLLVKTVDMIVIASTNSPDGILVTESQAKTEEKKPEENVAKKEGQEAGKEADKGHGSEEKPKEGEGGHGNAEEDPTIAHQERPTSIDEIKTYTDSEIEVLERLSERRDKLLKWEKDLQVKENVLKITEEKIDTKIDDLRKLKKDVELSLQEYRKEEDAKTKSLVKIYENMKPKSAADIMSKMATDNIVPIISKMKEKNAAEILAKMDPVIAKEVTNKLNEIGKIRSSSTR